MNAVAPITQFRQMVEARKGEIAARLPKHMTVEPPSSSEGGFFVVGGGVGWRG